MTATMNKGLHLSNVEDFAGYIRTLTDMHGIYRPVFQTGLRAVGMRLTHDQIDLLRPNMSASFEGYFNQNASPRNVWRVLDHAYWHGVVNLSMGLLGMQGSAAQGLKFDPDLEREFVKQIALFQINTHNYTMMLQGSGWIPDAEDTSTLGQMFKTQAVGKTAPATAMDVVHHVAYEFLPEMRRLVLECGGMSLQQLNTNVLDVIHDIHTQPVDGVEYFNPISQQQWRQAGPSGSGRQALTANARHL